MKKYSVVLAMVLVLALTVSAFAGSFSDVPSNHWAYDAVNKLVASGLITGYADGTYRGSKTLTRYEIAVVLSRLLNDIEEARAEMVDQVDFMVNDALIEANSGLSKAEGEEVVSIVEAVIKKNNPEFAAQNELSVDQAAEVMDIVNALTGEFESELYDLGVKVDGLDARVTELEKTSSVKFSGSYDVDFTDQYIDGDIIDEDIDYQYNDPYNGDGDPTTPDEIVYKDPYVYSDPWDDDSDTIDADKSNGEVKQTLNLQADIAKDGFTSTVKFDVHEDSDVDDVLVLDSAELALENDDIAAVYNDANTADIADYAFSGAEFNGVTVNFKNYGVDVFAGIKGYEVEGTQDTTSEEFEFIDGGTNPFTVEKDVNKFDDAGDPVKKEEDRYVFGATKTFSVADLDVNAKYAGKANLDKNTDDEAVLDNWLGADVAADLSGVGVTFDFGYYMPDEDTADDNGTLLRFGANKDFGLAGVEFNYKSRGEYFEPISEDGVVFDDGDDDYDKFTTGLGSADMSGYNLTVSPKLFEDMDLTTEFFYASVTEQDNDETKMSLTGEMPVLMDGLTANGEYTIVNPVEDADGTNENTLKVGADYEKDFLTANASYKMVTAVDFVDGSDKNVTAFGAAISDYPVFGALTANAGFDYESEAADFDKQTTEYNLGLGYLLGAADLSYDFTNKTVAGDSADAEGVYTTNKFGLTYPIVEGTDLVANYKILKLDLDEDGATLNNAGDYTVKELTAGVSVSF